MTVIDCIFDKRFKASTGLNLQPSYSKKIPSYNNHDHLKV